MAFDSDSSMLQEVDSFFSNFNALIQTLYSHRISAEFAFESKSDIELGIITASILLLNEQSMLLAPRNDVCMKRLDFRSHPTNPTEFRQVFFSC